MDKLDTMGAKSDSLKDRNLENAISAHRKAGIVITGAAGFIGSCLVGLMNEKGFENLILVDDFSREDKERNLEGKKWLARIEREGFFENSQIKDWPIQFFFHIGARTDTTEFDYSIHRHLNLEYSEKVWDFCTLRKIPLVYASSAATYGSGESGYEDDHEILPSLKPLNAYGISKNEFDKWAVAKNPAQSPPCWAGLKFFNVYGPNEYHKGRMASVVFHSYNQIKSRGIVKLFKSHRPGFRDGWQLRDFVYVKDLLRVCYWLMQSMLPGSWPGALNGIYNLGTGKARSFEDLAKATFAGLGLVPDIQYIDMPEDIREKYQYFTEARMNKLRKAGFGEEFSSLEDGVVDYVRNYLALDAFY
jgi:ADP-L-glycero-D-manno-heptose 6-epimerase